MEKESYPTILSIHIAKTAGTAFRELLQEYYGDRLCFFYGSLTNAACEPIAALPLNVKCLHGHFYIKDNHDKFPQAKYVTWMRDPVERVVSEYAHLKRQPADGNPLGQLIAQGFSLLDFAHHPDARNVQAKTMGSLNDFDFVGIAENFDAELQRLYSIVGLKLRSGYKANLNPDKIGPRYLLEDRVRALVTKLNQEDEELYRLAQEQVAAGTIV
ncbi:MAG: hypothetical protein EBT62_00980 [Opitutaceae bacterium]|nr:hypothetical protein [Opitutaceae bacterium]